MDDPFLALAEPRRREILAVIGAGELTAGQIAGNFAVTRPAISQHLSVLRASGLVSERRDGTRRLYRVRPEGFDGLRAWLDSFWRDGLARLKVEAEQEVRRR